MSCALLFSGQGGQHAAMLPWLEQASAAAPLLAALDRLLGTGWRGRLEERDWALSNRVAQPLIVGTALAAWAALAPRLARSPLAVAGYSVGELAAYAAAGVLEPEQALALAPLRARLMDDAVQGVATGLLSVAGLTEAAVLASCPALRPAIRIRVDHVLYAATVAELDAAPAALGPQATCKRVDVALASHSPWMHSAAAGFALELRRVGFAAPRCPVATNAHGRATRAPAVLADALSRQIDHTVEWGGCLAALAERRPSCVLEIGPGRALARMWEAQHPAIPARSIDDFRDAEGAASWVNRQSP